MKSIIRLLRRSIFIVVISLFSVFPTVLMANSPANLTSDIYWTDSGGVATPGNNTASYSGVDDIMAAFNHARRQEEIQLGLATNSISDLVLPSQTVWDGMSDDAKALYLLNDERTSRAGIATNVLGLPFAGVESSIDSIAENYAILLHDTDTRGHYQPSGDSSLDGSTKRIEQDATIGSKHSSDIVYSSGNSPAHADGTSHFYGDTKNGNAACHEFIARSENLAYFAAYSSGTISASSVPLPLERAIYNWNYADSGSSWGHREASLLQDETLSQQGSGWGFDNNNGDATHEGFIGVHVIGSTDYEPFTVPNIPGTSTPFNDYGVAVVLNIFDPVSDADTTSIGCNYSVALRTEDLPQIDNVSPTITAPADITVEATGATTSVSDATLGTASAADNVDATPTVTHSATTALTLGANTVVWTVTDSAGNTATDNQIVTVEDTTAPSITAPADITTASTGATTAVTLGTPTVSDTVDSSPTAAASPTGPFAVGTHTVTWIATDASGNTATDTQTVTISADTVDPTITAPADITVEATGATTSVSDMTLGTASAADNIDASPTVTHSATTALTLGANTVVWTVTDSAGNTATDNQIVTVEDTTAPSITAPADITTASTGATTAVTLGTPTVSDTVDSSPTAVASPTGPFAVGTHTVTWTATDASGNTATDTQTVTIQADASLAQTVTPSQTSFTVSPGDIVSFAVSYPESNPIASTGLGVTLYFDSSKLTFLGLVDILDTDLLTADNTPVPDTSNGDNDPSTDSTITVAWTDFGGNWPNALLPLDLYTIDFTANNGLTSDTTINFTGEAEFGFDFASTSVMVSPISDTVDPTITAPADITVEATGATTSVSDATLGTATAADNIDASPTVTHSATTALPLGANTVVWTVTDSAGNTATDNQTVTVEDTTAPSITAPADITTASTGATTAVTLGTPTVSDTVDSSPTAVASPTGPFAVGTHTVTWTATDASGNKATDTQNVTVTDDTTPGPGIAVIDGPSDGTSNNTLQIAHTLQAGNNRVLVVGTTIESNGLEGKTTSITYGGVTMHPISGSYATLTTSGFNMSTELFYLLESELPSNGSNTLEVSHNGNDVTAGVTLLTGVEQITPTTAATNSDSSTNGLSTQVSTSVANSIIIDVIGGGQAQGSRNFETSNPQTASWDANAPSSQGAASALLAAAAGSYTMQWNVSSGRINRATHSIAVFAPANGGVGPTNQAPVLSSIADQSVQEGGNASVSLSATDADGDSLQLSATSTLPSFISLQDNADGTGSLSINPTAGDAGVYSVTISVTDGNLTDSQTLQVTVTEDDTTPVTGIGVIDGPSDGTRNNTLQIAHTLQAGNNRVLVVGTTIESNGLEGKVSSITYGGVTMHPISGSYATLTTSGFNMSTELFYLLESELPSNGSNTLEVSHNGNDITAGVTLLTGVEQITPTTAATNSDSSTNGLSTQVSTSVANSIIIDVIGGGQAQGSRNFVTSNPQNASWDANAPSSQGAASALLAAAAGSYTMQWNVSSGRINRATHSIAVFAPANGGVGPTNQAPVLSSIADQSVQEGGNTSVSLSATDADGDNLQLSATSTLPSFISLQDNADGTGSLSINPTAGDAGVYSVTISVTDGNLTDSQTFQVTVTEDDTTPVTGIGVIDGPSDGTSNNTLQIAHTLQAGNNRVLVVGTTIESNGLEGKVSSITYSGVTMHPISGSYATLTTSGFNMSTELFYLLESELPSNGSNTLEVSHNGNDVTAGVTLLTGVEQITPTTAATNSDSSTNGLSTQVSTSVANSIIIDVIGGGQAQGSRNFETSNPQTASWDANAPSSQGAASTLLAAAAGSHTMQWNVSSGRINRATHSIAVFAPANGDVVVQPPVTPSTARLNDTGITTCGDYAFDAPMPNHNNDLDCILAPGTDGDGDPIPDGQDGQSVRVASFTKISAAGDDLPDSATEWACVRDNGTGFIWEAKTTSGLHSKDDKYMWYDPTATSYPGYEKPSDAINNPNPLYSSANMQPFDYSGQDDSLCSGAKGSAYPVNNCNMLEFAESVNQEQLCGLTGWRIPERAELRTLANAADMTASLTTYTDYFPNTVGSKKILMSGLPRGRGIGYALIETAQQDPYKAWTIYFQDSEFDHEIAKEELRYVRLVNGDAYSDSNRFEISNDRLTVTDNKTDLVWKRCIEGYTLNSSDECEISSGDNQTFTWSEVFTRTDQSYAGHSDWRVPNLNELASLPNLYEQYPAIDVSIFSTVPHLPNYWSSSVHTGSDSSIIWAVNFGNGGDRLKQKDTPGRAWLVRDANDQQLQ